VERSNNYNRQVVLAFRLVRALMIGFYNLRLSKPLGHNRRLNANANELRASLNEARCFDNWQQDTKKPHDR